MRLVLTNMVLSFFLLLGTNNVLTNFNNYRSFNDIPGRLFVLGDSLSDNGNLAQIFTEDTWHIDKVNFRKPFYHNSFSNGPVAANYLASSLRTTLNPAWYTNDTNNGNNYAVAGAQSGQNTDTWKYKLFLNHYALNFQAQQLLKDHKLTTKDKIFIEIGGNDLFAAMDKKTSLAQRLVISNAITTEFNTIETLINAGAKNLIISNVPDISNIPLYVNQTPPIKSLAHQLTTIFNNNWQFQIDNLMKNHTDINIKPFNLAQNFNNILQQAQQKGMNITNESVKWSITGLLLNRSPQYVNGTTPENMNNNFFFDYVHPNQWGHEQIGKMLIKLLK